MIWYAAYGSNLSRKRFECYLSGGCPVGSSHSYPGCRDSAAPRDDVACEIDLELAFGGNSRTWGGGVAFVRETEGALTKARLYLVTHEQFEDVVAQENWLDPGTVALELEPSELHGHVYGRVLPLPLRDDVPVMTISQSASTPIASPSVAYLRHIIDGLRESHQLSDDEIVAYLSSKAGVRTGELAAAVSAEAAHRAASRTASGAAEAAPHSYPDPMPRSTGTAAVRRYLEALETNRPKRGRKRTPDSVRKRLAAIEEQLGSAPAVQRLSLVQERINLEDELASMEGSADMDKLEADFVQAAKSYSEAKGISYTAWRELGVTADVLRKAGVARTRRKTV